MFIELVLLGNLKPENPYWLVVWNIFKNIFPFHIWIYDDIWDVILPIDELHRFSSWAHCTTNQKNYGKSPFLMGKSTI
jgi:hypothetical protein